VAQNENSTRCNFCGFEIAAPQYCGQCLNLFYNQQAPQNGPFSGAMIPTAQQNRAAGKCPRCRDELAKAAPLPELILVRDPDDRAEKLILHCAQRYEFADAMMRMREK